MARTLLAGERATTQAERNYTALKLEVQNASGTWKNVGALLGDDYVVGGTITEVLDTPVGSASFRIRRRSGIHSLAPLIFASALNVDDLGDYAPLIDIGRAVRASTSTLPPGVAPTTSDWREVFTGRIDDVAWESDPLTIACSDLGAWLMDTQIEVEGTEYGVPTTGVAMETVIQSIVDDWPSGKGVPTLLKQSTNTFEVTKWTQGRTKVLEAIRDLARQSTGEDVRFRYDATGVSKLTLFDPDRTGSTVDATFGPSEYRDVTQAGLSLANVRNVGVVPYVDASGVSHTATASDAISIANNGRRYFELPESPSITTSADASALIGKVVHDVAGSPLNHAIVTGYCWFVQLYDRYTFLANGDHYDQDQTLGVIGYEHTFEDGAAWTTITCRDRVIGAYADWLKGIRQSSPSTIEAYNQVLAQVTDSDAGTVTLTVTASSPTGTPTVQLVGLTGGATLVSGPAVGVQSVSGTVWVIGRPPAGGGVGQAQFRAVLGDNVDDDDFATIPAIGDTSTVYLVSRARVLASDATTVTVRYAVANPVPSGTATIAYQAQGVGGVTPASGGTVTPVATLSDAEAAGTYVDYVITKPAFGAGTGRVTFTATATARVSDSDAVDVPAITTDTVTPKIAITFGTPTATTTPFTGSAIDPSGRTTPGLTLLLKNCTASATGLVSDTVYAWDGSVVTIDRPPFDTTTQAKVIVTAAIPGGGTATQIIAIPNQVKTSFGPSLVVTTTPGSSTYSIAWTTANGAAVELSINGGAYSSAPASPISVTRTSSSQSYDFRATLDGQVMTAEAAIPALPSAASSAPSITGIYAYNAFYPGDGGGSFDVSWVSNNLPSGVTYDIVGTITAGNTSGSTAFSSTGNTASPVTINHPLGSAAPSCKLTITAKQDGTTICVGVLGNTAIAF